jgi:hypothetical protein
MVIIIRKLRCAYKIGETLRMKIKLDEKLDV